MHKTLKKVKLIGGPIITSLITVLVWYCLVEYSIVDELYLPHPNSVFDSLKRIDGLHIHLLYSTTRFVIGYSVGVIVGFLCGYLLFSNKIFKSAFFTLFESWRSIPIVAMIPFFLLWFGFSEFGKIFLVAFGVSMIIVVDTYNSMSSLPQRYLDTSKMLGLESSTAINKVILPYVIPELVSGMRISIAIGLGIVIVSEYMGARHGIGHIIDLAETTHNTSAILGCVVTISILSISFDSLLRKIANPFIIWKLKH